jgi:hypothetical protein
MKYQLVFQFEETAIPDHDSLLAFYDLLEAVLQPTSVLDGHDIGMGEFNLFVHTDEPQVVFEIVGQAIGTARPELPFASGYRHFDDDEYTPLWPRGSTKFSVS